MWTVEALGRIIIRGQSCRVLVWLSVWSKVQTTLSSTYKLYDLHTIFIPDYQFQKVLLSFLR